MVAAAGLVVLVGFLIWVYAILDVVTTDSALCRNLPKPGWLIFVVVAPLVGSLVWFIAGRPIREVPRSNFASPIGIEDRPDWPARADEILKGGSEPGKDEVRKAADERSRKLREWEARLIKREKELDDKKRRESDEGTEH